MNSDEIFYMDDVEVTEFVVNSETIVNADVVLSQATTQTKKRKRNVTREFSEEECFKLIAAVEKRECLWNVQSVTYKNRNMNQLAWEEVADECGIPKDACMIKWGLLRQQFRVRKN